LVLPSYLLLFVWGLSAAAQVITVFPASSGGPTGITSGPDGNLWFTENGFQIGRITPTGTVTEFNLPGFQCSAGLPEGCLGRGIVAGPDGNLWFVREWSPPSIGRITTDGVVTGIGGVPAGQLLSITVGSDGNLWTAPWGTGEFDIIIRLTPTGNVTTFPIPWQAGTLAHGAWSLATGPDGNVWFTDPDNKRIGRITPSGEVTGFSLPAFVADAGIPNGITGGPDNALWFTTFGVPEFICRISTAGEVTGYPIANLTSGPQGICLGPDGNIWFTENTPPKIGRCTPTGVITEYDVPGGLPWSITAGPDGNVWFTLSPFYIGRVNLGVVAAMEGKSIPAVSPAGLIILGITLASAGFFLSRLAHRA
jgi:streptogramin lyase